MHCGKFKPEVTQLGTAIIVLLVLLAVAVVLGSLLYRRRKISSTAVAESGAKTFVTMFAMQSSLQRLWAKQHPQAKPFAILNGLRTISILWIILGHFTALQASSMMSVLVTKWI
jgi:hypothetical protein